jgi:hypothetical protein
MRLNAYATKSGNLKQNVTNGKGWQSMISEEWATAATEEIERLRKDKRELLQIAKLFADYGKCDMADESGDCIHIDGVCEWHGAEHLWESFCMARGI